jgi:serine/threonine protein kinase
MMQPHMARAGQTTNPFTVGQRVFERYYLKRTLGSGGMSTVWLAHDRLTEQPVVLKFLSPHLIADEKEVERLRMEALRSHQLIHPNIVQVHDFIHSGNGVAVAMEYVDGWSLWSMKVDKPGQRFTPEEIAPWMRDLCAALEHAHAAEVVHRDIKPANLILDSRGRLKLADFGLSRSTNPEGFDTGYYRVVGTDWYMSPQQWTGDPPAIADDIYALGATIYELLTGKPPFYEGDVLKQSHEEIPLKLTERLVKFGVRKPKIPAAWEETVAACLDKDAARRPVSVKDVATRLGL